MIRKADLIIIDEISMMDKCDFERVNRLCKEYAEPMITNRQPFGAKVILVAGDFDQLLTVVAGGHAIDQVDATVTRHELWDRFEQGLIQLTENMRLEQGEEDFRAW